MKFNVIAIKIDKRNQNAFKVQEVLTKNGCLIQNRIGFHETSEKSCSDTGMIILVLLDRPEDINVLKNDLSKIDGVVSSHITL